MKTSEQTDKLYPAILEASNAMGKLTKNAKNGHFGGKYANLGAVQEACIPAFHEAGIIVIQCPENTERGVVVRTRLIHAASTQWLESELEAPLAKQDAQSVGSAVTYLRRYSLQAIAGLAAEDDDGEGAMGRSQPLPERGRAKTSEPKPKPEPKPPSGPVEDDTADDIFMLWEQLGVADETRAKQVMAVTKNRTDKIGETTQNEATRLLESLKVHANKAKP